MSLRQFIEHARQAGRLIEIQREVSSYLELARVAAALDGRPVLFHHVSPHPRPHPQPLPRGSGEGVDFRCWSARGQRASIMRWGWAWRLDN